MTSVATGGAETLSVYRYSAPVDFQSSAFPQAHRFVGIAASIPVLTLARNAILHTATSIPEISPSPFSPQ